MLSLSYSPRMKKIVIFLASLVLVVLIAVGVFVSFFLNSAVKKAVETIGPEITKVSIQIANVHLSPLSGSGEISGLVVGNPQGFKAPDLLKAEKIAVALQPSSLLSKKVIIRSIVIQSPEITFEGGLHDSNITKLQENVNQSLGSSNSEKRKFQVDDLLIQNGKLNISLGLLGGKGASVPLPDIHLTQLGTGPEGITAAQLVQEITGQVMKNTTQLVSGVIGNLGDQGKEAVEGAVKMGEEAAKGVEGAVKGIGDLFK